MGKATYSPPAIYIYHVNERYAIMAGSIEAFTDDDELIIIDNEGNYDEAG